MTSAVYNITFDCSDAGAVASFWSAVTGWVRHEYQPRPGQKEYGVGPAAEGDVRLYFVTVPEPKTAKNRVHLDVKPQGDQGREIARLVELGASVTGDQPPDAGWVVLRDPEGNEFCVEPGS
jgi:predicted enzyme related to lactoylglutathione lyase